MRLAAIGDNCVDFMRGGWAYPGGNAVNVAVYGRQLGMDTAYLGWIGTDTFGDMMQEKLRGQGWKLSVCKEERKTAVTYIELLDGDRKFGEDFLNVMEGFQLSGEDLRYLADFDCVHMAVWGNAMPALANCRLQ
ncbi:MAG: PfkB family carbohydrate kinase [Blautia marasmi]